MNSHSAEILFFSFDDDDSLDTDLDDDLGLEEEEDDFSEDEEDDPFGEDSNPWEYDDRDDF